MISDSGVPETFTQTISGSAIKQITEVRVGLHLIGATAGGGWAGDMFVSLNRGGFQTSILLNQPGVTVSSPQGYGFDGWNVTFLDSAPNGDAHGGQPTSPATVLTGQWQPDGRQNPLSSTHSAMLSTFNGLGANAPWNLTIADLNPGGNMILESWSLTFIGSAVPEPREWAAITALALCAFGVARRARQI